jgi:hypothetical protein
MTVWQYSLAKFGGKKSDLTNYGSYLNQPASQVPKSVFDAADILHTIMEGFMDYLENYRYNDLPAYFRILKLLPGNRGDEISILLHFVDWNEHLEFYAISYS